MQVTGRITRILDKISGQKRDGSGTWEKQSFVVETNDNYNNIYCFEVFGADKVSSFNSQYEIGSDITIDIIRPYKRGNSINQNFQTKI